MLGHLDEPIEKSGIRNHPDKDKGSVAAYRNFLVGFDVFDLYRLDLTLAFDGCHRTVKYKAQIRPFFVDLIHQFFGQHARSPEFLPPVDHHDFACELRQMHRLFDSGIASADGYDFAPLKKRSVARPTITYARPCIAKLLLAGDVKLAIRTARSKYHRTTHIYILIAGDLDIAVVEPLKRRYFRSAFDLGSEIRYLTDQFLDKLRSADRIESRIILDPVGSSDLSTREKFLQNQRLKPVPCRIQRRPQPCRPSADYYAVIYFLSHDGSFIVMLKSTIRLPPHRQSSRKNQSV